jgi:DNA (cytosine-5)-methyltransferase 1
MLRRKYGLVSLFTGAGGLDIGFEKTGRYEFLLANEIRPKALDAYSSYFKVKKTNANYRIEDLPIAVLGDVEELDFRPLKKATEPSVIVGGPPCQDFSIVRGPQTERRGIEVKRGRLYSHFIRALATLQPIAFVFENVKGLKSANKGLAHSKIVNDFSNLESEWYSVKEELGRNNGEDKIHGYHIVYDDIVNMANFGVPQQRERLIIIGLRKDVVPKDRMDFLMTLTSRMTSLLEGKNELIKKYPLTPIEVFEGNPLNELQDKYESMMKEYDGIWDEVGTPKAYEWKKKAWDTLTFDIVKDYLSANGIKNHSTSELNRAFQEHKEILIELGYLGQNVRDLNPPDGSNILPNDGKRVKDRMRHIPPDQNHEFVRGTKWEVEGRGMSLIYRRLHPLKPAYTVVAHGGGGTWGYHFERNRATLTCRENARLQTFPDNFMFKGKRSDIRSQIGEAVPPLGAKRIAESVSILLEISLRGPYKLVY